MWQSLWCYHPRIGYTYIPNIQSRVPFANGAYLVRTNAAGFRSDREFVQERQAGTFRILLFGDSQTAGEGVSNIDRYSDRVERAIHGLEVYNCGLTGTGTDQQYLAYLENAPHHDLLVIAVNVENIKRVNCRFLKFRNTAGDEVFYPKPYYELVDGELVLRQVPVPKRPWTLNTLPPDAAGHVDWGDGIFPKAQAALRKIVPNSHVREAVKKLGMRDVMQRVTRFQPVPEYEDADDPRCVLLRSILADWIRRSSVPVLVLPLPMWMFIEGTSDPSAYQARFRELAEQTGCQLHDPLPDLQKHSPRERRTFRFEADGHYSPRGHAALARSLAPVVERLMGATPP